ncbi:hypothetical protein L484_028081 [Morus notabilis]|uniref:Uncharacterized protein n=1 Tax=Morus notabilis TaxID=981085 RepID=W9SWD4_9ROSA|nr:hypothetical protein L484_028081 [Morus notabilis]
MPHRHIISGQNKIITLEGGETTSVITIKAQQSTLNTLLNGEDTTTSISQTQIKIQRYPNDTNGLSTKPPTTTKSGEGDCSVGDCSVPSKSKRSQAIVATKHRRQRNKLHKRSRRPI